MRLLTLFHQLDGLTVHLCGIAFFYDFCCKLIAKYFVTFQIIMFYITSCIIFHIFNITYIAFKYYFIAQLNVLILSVSQGKQRHYVILVAVFKTCPINV